MSEHAPLAPSSASEWGHCSGSVLAQVGIPNRDTEQTRKGNAGHWVAASTLRAHKSGATTGLLCSDYVGQSDPDGTIIDDEMAEGAQVYVDDVLEVCHRFDCLADLLIEHRVYMPKIHAQNWGTLDAGIYLPARRLVHLWDYKGGHRDVQAVGHFQMVDYLQGLVEEYGIDGHADQQITAVVRVVQPFCYYARGPIKEWTVPLCDLRAYWNILQAKATEAFTNPLLTTGLWCRDCRALGKCAATRRARYNFIELVNQPYEMDAMDGADMAVERLILEDGIAVAKKRLEAIEDELQHRIKDGDSSSRLTVEAVPGRLEWAVPVPQAVALFSQFGVNIRKEGALTPTQSLQKVPKEQRRHVDGLLKRFTKRRSAITLVPVEESRNARAFKPKTEQ